MFSSTLVRLAELESFDLDFKQMKSRGMADGGCDIADDEVLRRSITKTLLEIDELKVVAELEMLEQSARMKDAEASKIQEERLKAWETERMMTEEEKEVPGEAQVHDRGRGEEKVGGGPRGTEGDCRKGREQTSKGAGGQEGSRKGSETQENWKKTEGEVLQVISPFPPFLSPSHRGSSSTSAFIFC